jgi:quercetin dioxygenase-like cupin family protein
LCKQGAANRGIFRAAHTTEWETTVSKLKLNRVSVGVFTACALGLIAWKVAWATPSAGLSTTILTGPVLLGDLDLKSKSDIHEVKIKTKGDSHVYIVHNRIIPGGSTGWHSHPGISFVTVKSGVVSEYHGGDPQPHVYAAGEGFTEEAGAVHNMVNEGSTDLELVAFQIIPAGAMRRIDEPQP